MPPDPLLLSILSDQPADEDQLGFAPYARTLAEIVAVPGTRTPLTIGIFGDWGRGKTSLMRTVQGQLDDTAGSDFPVRTVWLNAWLYSREQALWRALISRVLDGARGFPTLDQAAQDRLTQLESRIYGAAAPAGGHLVLPAGAMAGLEGAALPPLTHEFCSRDGLSAMVEKTITYCQKQDCMADLLAEVKKANPRRYAQYEGDLSGKG